MRRHAKLTGLAIAVIVAVGVPWLGGYEGWGELWGARQMEGGWGRNEMCIVDQADRIIGVRRRVSRD